ncbi:DUF4232 domain-containing protein [Streptomyces sp. JNUCC 64]
MSAKRGLPLPGTPLLRTPLPGPRLRDRRTVPVRRGRTALAVALPLLAAVSGCGLSAELERERHPTGRPTPPPYTAESPTARPGPSATAPSAAVPSAAVPSAPGVRPGPDPARSPAGRTAPDPCEEPGVRLRAEHTGAAMGLRALVVVLTNCGTEPYALNGHPRVDLADAHGIRLPGVRTVDDLSAVPMAPSAPPATAFALERGESAEADVMWRANTGAVPSLGVRARPGAPRVLVTPAEPLDAGPRNVVGVSAWRPR